MVMEKRQDNLISIIVPVYKAMDYIGCTIKNVQEQTYRNFELILVDDASPDDSYKIIEEMARHDDRIRLIRKEKNEGAASARNTGIDASRGRYIAFLDADDVWKKDKLEKELSFMHKKDAGFVFTSYEFGDEDANPTGKLVRVPETLRYRQALSRTIIFTSTVLIDLEKVDINLVHMPLIESEDTATWWTILMNGIVAYGLDEVLVVYRRPAKSLSSNKFKAVKRIWGLYRKIAKLSPVASVVHLLAWGVRATMRRL